jgi:hypothetical protein
MPRASAPVEEIDELEELDELIDPDEEPAPKRVAKKVAKPAKKVTQPEATAADIRAWASGYDLDIAMRGRIHPTLQAAYEADDPDLWRNREGAAAPAKPKAAPRVLKSVPAAVVPNKPVARTPKPITAPAAKNGHLAATSLSVNGVELIIDGDTVRISAPGKTLQIN